MQDAFHGRFPCDLVLPLQKKIRVVFFLLQQLQDTLFGWWFRMFAMGKKGNLDNFQVTLVISYRGIM